MSDFCVLIITAKQIQDKDTIVISIGIQERVECMWFLVF